MSRRLTSFSKFLITLLILGALFFGIRFLINQTDLGNLVGTDKDDERPSRQNSRSTVKREDVLRVQLVTWGGYAPGLYYNEGGRANTRSRFYKDYGFQVEFILNDNLENALNAWVADEYDVLVQTADAFPLYTAPVDINAYGPKAFMQVDWSRGGDVIIAKRGIRSINDLKGRRVAVAEPSPSQTLLITALEAAGLTYNDITVVASPDPVVAATTFKGPDVDAAVVWSPFHLEALREIAGSTELVSTRDQSHIIGDIMFAKESFIQSNPDKINGFYEGWMKAVAELHSSESNQTKASKLLGEFLGFSEDDAMGAMADVRWASHGDNMNFFGLNPEYRGMKGSDLYTKMAKVFLDLKQAERVAPPWRSVSHSGAILAANTRLSGRGFEAESAPSFSAPTEEEKTAPAVASKPITINFATAQFQLSENAKTIIDLQFADIARSFANMRVRIEGNTDSVGSRSMNVDLSTKRAQSVANYLVSTYGLDRNRFVIVGNGPDKPVAGCESNATEDCRAKNRRTEFQLISTVEVQ